MSKYFTNQEISALLHKFAIGLELKGENRFKIRAYEDLAATIDHYSSDLYELWSEGKLDEVPGVGEHMSEYLNELFSTGKVKHFEQTIHTINPFVYELDAVPGIGAKIAFKLVKVLKVNSFKELKKALKQGKLKTLAGFGEKSEKKIALAIDEYEKTEKRERMLLYDADRLAQSFIDQVPTNSYIQNIQVLGSIRRRVPTIGDVDFGVITDDSEKVVTILERHPMVKKVEDQGEHKITLQLKSGRRVDILMQPPHSFGSLLQHFTGSKAHNIQLRNYALKKGKSLSEYGIKNLHSSGDQFSKDFLIKTRSEKEFYKLLNLQYIPPELREGTDEIGLAERRKIPKLVEFSDIQGDVHMHSNYPAEPSHDLGKDSIEVLAQRAKTLGYSYIGIADHSPAFSTHSREATSAIIKKRKDIIEYINKQLDYIEVINCMEVDILTDGSLSVNGEQLKDIKLILAGIHSSHSQSNELITQRLKNAIIHPKVHIMSHPTGRLLLQRNSFDVEWKKLFELCAKNYTVLEINASPSRLDLPDYLVKEAKEMGVKFCINTDAHAVESLDFMPYGVDVARRGWCTRKDIINTWSWEEIVSYFRKGGKEI